MNPKSSVCSLRPQSIQILLLVISLLLLEGEKIANAKQRNGVAPKPSPAKKTDKSKPKPVINHHPKETPPPVSNGGTTITVTLVDKQNTLIQAKAEGQILSIKSDGTSRSEPIQKDKFQFFPTDKDRKYEISAEGYEKSSQPFLPKEIENDILKISLEPSTASNPADPSLSKGTKTKKTEIRVIAESEGQSTNVSQTGKITIKTTIGRKEYRKGETFDWNDKNTDWEYEATDFEGYATTHGKITQEMVANGILTIKLEPSKNWWVREVVVGVIVIVVGLWFLLRNKKRPPHYESSKISREKTVPGKSGPYILPIWPSTDKNADPLARLADKEADKEKGSLPPQNQVPSSVSTTVPAETTEAHSSTNTLVVNSSLSPADHRGNEYNLSALATTPERESPKAKYHKLLQDPQVSLGQIYLELIMNTTASALSGGIILREAPAQATFVLFKESLDSGLVFPNPNPALHLDESIVRRLFPDFDKDHYCNNTHQPSVVVRRTRDNQWEVGVS